MPLISAHLDGATQLTLRGTLHSINEAGSTTPTDRWYGADGEVDKWLGKAQGGAMGAPTGLLALAGEQARRVSEQLRERLGVFTDGL